MAGGMQTKVGWIGRASRGHAGMFVFRSLAFSGLLLAIHAPALAVDRSWLGGSGSWGTSSSWTPTGVPTTGDTADVSGTNGTVVSLLTTSGSSGVGITVRSGNTLLGNGVSGNTPQRLGNGDTLTNQGTIENAVIFTANTVTNTGLIQANGAGKYMNLAAAVTFANTGGTVRAVNGGILNVISNVTVSNGTLSIDSTSSLQFRGDNRTFTLNNVAATNNGTMTLGMNVNATNDRSVQTNLNGTTTFDNFGTINLSLVSPAGSTSGTKNSQMVVASAATFTNRSAGTLNVLAVEVGQLLADDIFDLRLRHLADDLRADRLGARLDTRSLLEEEADRRRLGDEREAAILEHGDDHRDRHAGIHFLGAGVELLAEFHDVDALLTERGPDRRRRIGLASRHLQLDVGLNLFSHSCPSCGRRGTAMARPPAPIFQSTP